MVDSTLGARIKKKETGMKKNKRIITPSSREISATLDSL
jgi:hypothetical protein